MDNNEAIRPNFYKDFTTKVDKIVDNPLTDDQQALAYITHFKGWELMKASKVRLEEYLDAMVNDAISKGLSMNEIGERTMVKEMAKYVLNSFVSKADAARRTEDER